MGKLNGVLLLLLVAVSASGYKASSRDVEQLPVTPLADDEGEPRNVGEADTWRQHAATPEVLTHMLARHDAEESALTGVDRSVVVSLWTAYGTIIKEYLRAMKREQENMARIATTVQSDIPSREEQGYQDNTYVTPAPTVQPGILVREDQGYQDNTYVTPAPTVQPGILVRGDQGYQDNTYVTPAPTVQPGILVSEDQGYQDNTYVTPAPTAQPGILVSEDQGYQDNTYVTPAPTVQPGILVSEDQGYQDNAYVTPAPTTWPYILFPGDEGYREDHWVAPRPTVQPGTPVHNVLVIPAPVNKEHYFSEGKVSDKPVEAIYPVIGRYLTETVKIYVYRLQMLGLRPTVQPYYREE